MTLIQDILEELRPDLPADFRFGVLHDRWDDVIMTEFQTRGQTAGSWVNADAPPREVAEKLLRDLQAQGADVMAVAGDVADEVLASARVLPQRLLEVGHDFAHPHLDDALDHLL